MICKKCGNELNIGERFCPKCGTAAPPAFCSRCGGVLNVESSCPHCGATVLMTVSNQLKEQAGKLRDAAKSVSQSLPASLAPKSTASGLSSFPISYIGIAALHILLAILWFCKTITISALGIYSEKFSMQDICKQSDSSWLTVITVILLLAGAVFALLPLVRQDIEKLKKLTIPKIASIWTTLWFIGQIIYSTHQAGNYHNYNASVGITFGGFLFILAGIGAIALPLILSPISKAQLLFGTFGTAVLKKMEKNNENEGKSENNENN